MNQLVDPLFPCYICRRECEIGRAEQVTLHSHGKRSLATMVISRDRVERFLCPRCQDDPVRLDLVNRLNRVHDRRKACGPDKKRQRLLENQIEFLEFILWGWDTARRRECVPGLLEPEEIHRVGVYR